MLAMLSRGTVPRRLHTIRLPLVPRLSSPKIWRVSTMDRVLMWLIANQTVSQWLTSSVSYTPLDSLMTLRMVMLLNTICLCQYAMPLPSTSHRARLLIQLLCTVTICLSRVWHMLHLVVYVTSTTCRFAVRSTLRRRDGNPIAMPWSSIVAVRPSQLTKCYSSPTPKSNSRG
jgi:hypothetical protein